MFYFFIFFVILVILSGSLYFLFKKNLILKKELKEKKEIEESLNYFEKINLVFNEFRKEIENKIENVHKEIYNKLEKTTEKTAKIEELARILESYTFDIKKLNEILTGTKTRGIFGEFSLEQILSLLPNSIYEKQYRIGLNYVDFVIKINDYLIPIDSKFPYSSFVKILETLSEDNKLKFRKELINYFKKHIDDINRKYIMPLKGTVEFAILYLPAEGIYNEILNKEYQDIWDYAREKYVFITSPKNFENFVMLLSFILKKQEFSRNLYQIINQISQLEKDLIEIAKKLETSKNQLTNSYSNLEEVYRMFNRLYFNFKNLLNKEYGIIKEDKKIKSIF